MLQRILPLAGSLCRKFWKVQGMEAIPPGVGAWMTSEPQEALAIYVTCQNGEVVLCIAPGDHTVQRWRIGKNSGKRLASDLVQHYLANGNR